MAEVISLFGQRVRRRAEEVAEDRPNLSDRSHTDIARRDVAPSVPRPAISPDDPIYGLFDTYKSAEKKYRDALWAMAERHDLPVQNMAARLRAVRNKQHGLRRSKGGTPEERAVVARIVAKYDALTASEQTVVMTLVDGFLASQDRV